MEHNCSGKQVIIVDEYNNLDFKNGCNLHKSYRKR